jgi:hypothetical protein
MAEILGYADITLVVISLVVFLVGFSKGFARMGLVLASLFLSVVLAFNFSKGLSEKFYADVVQEKSVVAVEKTLKKINVEKIVEKQLKGTNTGNVKDIAKQITQIMSNNGSMSEVETYLEKQGLRGKTENIFKGVFADVQSDLHISDFWLGKIGVVGL